MLLADSPEFRIIGKERVSLEEEGYGAAAIIHWWNGFSACYDTTNPEAMEYLKQQLRANQEKYGIDGFKFDGADISYMTPGEYDFYDKDATPNTFMEKWAALGLSFPYNGIAGMLEAWGPALMQRLGDKDYHMNATRC